MAKGVSDEVWREANEIFREIDIEKSVKHHADMDARRKIEALREQKELEKFTQEFNWDDI